jgi:hypothetical protein
VTVRAKTVALRWGAVVSLAGAAAPVGMMSACGSSGTTNAQGQPQATEWTLASPPSDTSRYIQRAMTAGGVTEQGWAVHPATRFQVNQAIFVTFDVQGVGAGAAHRVGVRWFLNGALVPVAGAHSSQLVSYDGPAFFSLSYPAPGNGLATLYWDEPVGDNNDAADERFLAHTVAFTIA